MRSVDGKFPRKPHSAIVWFFARLGIFFAIGETALVIIAVKDAHI